MNEEKRRGGELNILLLLPYVRGMTEEGRLGKMSHNTHLK